MIALPGTRFIPSHWSGVAAALSLVAAGIYRAEMEERGIDSLNY